MNYTMIRSNAGQFLSMTSLTVEEFDDLLAIFEVEHNSWMRKFNLDGSPRLRSYSAKTVVTSNFCLEKRLFFILYYEKNNPIQESLGAMFDLRQPLVNVWIKILSPLLARCLKAYDAERNPSYFSENVEINKSYISDCVETRVQRDMHDQELYYSGKKKHIR